MPIAVSFFLMLAAQSEGTMPQKRNIQDTKEISKKLKSSNERDEFLASFEIIAKEMIADLAEYRLPENGVAWLKNMFYETIPGGNDLLIRQNESWIDRCFCFGIYIEKIFE
jgi:hypothetical protein